MERGAGCEGSGVDTAGGAGGASGMAGVAVGSSTAAGAASSRGPAGLLPGPTDEVPTWALATPQDRLQMVIVRSLRAPTAQNR